MNKKKLTPTQREKGEEALHMLDLTAKVIAQAADPVKKRDIKDSIISQFPDEETRLALKKYLEIRVGQYEIAGLVVSLLEVARDKKTFAKGMLAGFLREADEEKTKQFIEVLTEVLQDRKRPDLLNPLVVAIEELHR